MTRSLSFPFHADDHRAAATSGHDETVRQQIEQLLLTIPGERVDRPDFGCGIQLLVFEGGSAQVSAATEYVVRAGLRRYLADVVAVEGVRVSVVENELRVEVLYTVLATGQASALTVAQPLEAPA